jgi:AAHS family 4-hydroxybenzoate transporter-like MFS transporter
MARATGVSWMLGMGRFGSIFGSAFGGALLGLGLGFGPILAMLAIPATCAAIAVLATQRGSSALAAQAVRPRREAASPASVRRTFSMKERTR